MPRENFPTILLVDGRGVKVEWETLGTIIDEFGDTIELFMPVFPAGFLVPAMSESLFNNIRAWNVTSNESYDVDRVMLLNANLSPESIFEEAKFGALRRQVNPNILEMEGVEDFLLSQLKGQRGAGLSPNFIKSIKAVTDEMAANPSNIPNILGRFIPGWEETQRTAEEMRQEALLVNAQFASGQILQPFTSIQNRLLSGNEFQTEQEYQQALVNELAPKAAGIYQQKPGEFQYSPSEQLENEARQQLLSEYQAAQKRLTEIEAGGEQRWGIQDWAARQASESQKLHEGLAAGRAKPQSELDKQFANLIKRSKKRVSYL